mgnify:FL=1
MSGVKVTRDGVTMTVCDEKTAANLATAGWKPIQASRKTTK